MGEAVSIILITAFFSVCAFSVSTDYRNGKIYNTAFLGMLLLVIAHVSYALFRGEIPDFFMARVAGFFAMVAFVYVW